MTKREEKSREPVAQQDMCDGLGADPNAASASATLKGRGLLKNSCYNAGYSASCCHRGR